MSGAEQRVVIIGGSVAGIRLARALRECGHSGSIRIVEAGQDLPHDRPPLSKVALGADPFVPLLRADEVAELGLDLTLGSRAVRIDQGATKVELESGESVEYDVLVLATGLRCRQLPWAGPNIHTLRSVSDARAFREQLGRASSLLIVGAGFIGAEAAATARAAGIQVTMVDPVAVPMARVVGDELGLRLAGLQSANGVDLRLGTSLVGLTSQVGGVEATLSDGSVLHVDVVLVGIGAEVDAAWLVDSGIPMDDGVVCDEFGRVLDTPRVFAIGDVARWQLPDSSGSRTEHWTSAVDQAVCVANNIMRPDSLSGLSSGHFVWSDQYDWKIQVFGRPDPAGTPEIIELAEPFRLAAVWRDDVDQIRGGVTINWPRASVTLRRAIATGSSFSTVVEDVNSLGRPA